MYRDSLQQICAMLVANNTSTSLRERDLLVTQWHCMGRAVETGLRHSSMKFVPKPIGALQFIVGRSKTNVYQHVHAFCDRESWEADIFHAKASHLAACANVDDEFQFRNVTAKMINTILSNVCGQTGAEELSKFTSHLGRRGCASEALSHNGVSVTEVIARGGWAFDAVSRVFLYFCGRNNGDMRVGRVIAGWPETDKGGIPPNANSPRLIERAFELWPWNFTSSISAFTTRPYSRF
jgi:hypothetical protein